MKNKDVLFLGNTNGYIEKLFKKEHRKILDIYINNISKSKIYIRKLHFLFNLPCKNYWYALDNVDLTKYKLIVIFECLYPTYLISYLRKKTSARIIYWLWDPVKRINNGKIYNSFKENLKLNSLKKTKKYNCEIWSFDKLDCKKYGFLYNNQVTIKAILPPLSIEQDCLYVGHYKNSRDIILEKLGDILYKSNLSYYFCIVSTNKTIQNNKYRNLSIINKEYTYSEILKCISKSKCIIELVDKNQNGITWKPLEALFYKKKLITNYYKIKDYDFYDKRNIFILGKDNINNLKTFINTPYVPINEKIIYKYTIDGWINNFLTKTQN